MATKATGRHRADVEINILESFELRSRRSVLESETARQSRLARKQAKKLAEQLAVQRRQSQNSGVSNASGRYLVRAERKAKLRQHRGLKNVVTMSVAAGLMATFALPAYAYAPDVAAMSRFTTTDAQVLASAADTQNLTVAAVNTVLYARGNYESASASEIARQETLNAYRSYTGPTAADYVNNPPYSKLDGATILQVASKYVGTPYVFGGETPAGFDCSGFVAFVFSQFGLALPHSVHGENRLGILIKPEDAQPGDLVVFDDLSHDGIYAGNGNFYHAPRPGDFVKLAPIFTSNIHFVRLATK